MGNKNQTKNKKSWAELSPTAKVAIIAGAVAELATKVGVWQDLRKRPAAQIRGPKWAWALAALVNGIGPAAYWAVGRKR